MLVVIAVKTSNSPHTYVFKTLYSMYKFLFYYIPEFLVFLFMLLTALHSKYFCSVVGNFLFAWFGWMYCDCRYTPGKCGSFTDQSQCLSTRPGVKCVWNSRQLKCQPISGLSHLFVMTVSESQDTQTTEEEIYRYEKCHYWASHSFILPLLLHPYGIWVLNYWQVIVKLCGTFGHSTLSEARTLQPLRGWICCHLRWNGKNLCYWANFCPGIEASSVHCRKFHSWLPTYHHQNPWMFNYLLNLRGRKFGAHLWHCMFIVSSHLLTQADTVAFI